MERVADVKPLVMTEATSGWGAGWWGRPAPLGKPATFLPSLVGYCSGLAGTGYL